MYIGKTPTVGNFQKCDAITTSATATFNLLVGAVAVSPETSNHCIVSLNGVIQAPGASGGFTISGSTIVFNSALTTADVIDFILILGNVLDIGTPSDGTVTAAKIDDTAISGKTALAVAPADTDEFLVSDGGVLKRLDYSLIKGGGNLLQLKTVYKQDTFSVAGNSGVFSDVTDVTVDISPTLSTSKILVFLTTNISNGTHGYGGIVRLVRDSTTIMGGTASGNRNMIVGGAQIHNNGLPNNVSAVYLDAPATTSATTYKLQGSGETGSTFYVNRTGADQDLSYLGRTPTTLTVMEIAVGVL